MDGILEYLIEVKNQSGMVVTDCFDGIDICYCTDEERKTFDTYEAAETWMRDNNLSSDEYFVAEHVFH